MRADEGERLGDDAMALCVRSGLRRVMIGVEFGAQDMMDWMQKDISVEQVLKSADYVCATGSARFFPSSSAFRVRLTPACRPVWTWSSAAEYE